MHERQDLGEARGKSETDKARQNLESEVLVRLNGLSEMSGLRPRSRDGRKSRTVTPRAQARIRRSSFLKLYTVDKRPQSAQHRDGPLLSGCVTASLRISVVG